jgi:hypothetical protein
MKRADLTLCLLKKHLASKFVHLHPPRSSLLENLTPMSEFEGYQGGDGTAQGAQYQSIAGQPVAPADEAQVKANLVADGVNAAESKINAIVDKIGKNGVLLGICVASLIYTIAAGSACFILGVTYCIGVNAFAFAAGIISLVVSLLYIVLLRFTQVCRAVVVVVLRRAELEFESLWRGGATAG